MEVEDSADGGGGLGDGGGGLDGGRGLGDGSGGLGDGGNAGGGLVMIVGGLGVCDDSGGGGDGSGGVGNGGGGGDGVGRDGTGGGGGRFRRLSSGSCGNGGENGEIRIWTSRTSTFYNLYQVVGMSTRPSLLFEDDFQIVFAHWRLNRRDIKYDTYTLQLALEYLLSTFLDCSSQSLV